jgi:hypothetical protein
MYAFQICGKEPIILCELPSSFSFLPLVVLNQNLFPPWFSIKAYLTKQPVPQNFPSSVLNSKILKERRGRERTRAFMHKILQRSLPTITTPLLHSPGGYSDPEDFPAPPASLRGAPYPSPRYLALARGWTDHLGLHPSSLPSRPNRPTHPSL